MIYSESIKSPLTSVCPKCLKKVRFNIRSGKTSKCNCNKIINREKGMSKFRAVSVPDMKLPFGSSVSYLKKLAA